LHFYTLNSPTATRAIGERLNLRESS
jgi:hypothetical protein